MVKKNQNENLFLLFVLRFLCCGEANLSFKRAFSISVIV